MTQVDTPEDVRESTPHRPRARGSAPRIRNCWSRSVPCAPAIVMPGIFAIAHVSFSNAQVSLFASFGSFALLLLVEFTGPVRTRVVSYLSPVRGWRCLDRDRDRCVDQQGRRNRHHGRGGLPGALRRYRDPSSRNGFDRGAPDLRAPGGGGPAFVRNRRPLARLGAGGCRLRSVRASSCGRHLGTTTSAAVCPMPRTPSAVSPLHRHEVSADPSLRTEVNDAVGALAYTVLGHARIRRPEQPPARSRSPSSWGASSGWPASASGSATTFSWPTRTWHGSSPTPPR